MESLGGLGLENEELKEETATTFEEKKNRLPWHTWKVGEQEYKLKLTTANILKLEDKYRCNIANLIMADGTPPLSVMLTIIHAAMLPYHHKVSYADVQKIYEKWAEDKGNQQVLFGKVVMPIMAVSGFFTENQIQAMQQAIENEI